MITETIAKEILQSFSEAEGGEFSLDENGNCSIISDEERVTHLHFNSELGEIQLCGIVGQLPYDNEELSTDIIRYFMVSNFMWIDSMGGTFSLEPDNNNILFQKSYKDANELKENFKGILVRFDNELGYWMNTFLHLPEELDDIDVENNG